MWVQKQMVIFVGLRLLTAKRRPLGQELLMADQGVAAELAGLTQVLVPEGFELNLHGLEDRVVFVHRFVATETTLTESEDFRSLFGLPWSPRQLPTPSRDSVSVAMILGEVYLESLSTGIITPDEIDWITTHQAVFSREEEAMALKIGRLLDEGSLQIGCRLFAQPPLSQPPTSTAL